MDASFDPLRQRFTLPVAYEVHFTTGLFQTDNPLLADVLRATGENLPKKMLVVVDDGVVRHHPHLLDQITAYAGQNGEIVTLAGRSRVIPGGERCKNSPELLDLIQRDISERGVCRHSYVLAIGGGAVLDLVGYAAATAHRGVRLLRAPTTVLAQNDSGVGVKNGVNAFGKKNFLGAFAPPCAVLNDFAFLATLDNRDWRAGIAEAVKVALIKDPAFFTLIEDQADALARRDLAAMQQIIYHCARLHAAHIAGAGDPFERGSGRPLDFGHWSAHKLESLTDFALRHGEAVAIGITLDSVYSHVAGMLAERDLRRILRTLSALGFRLFVPELREHLRETTHPRCLFRGLEEFREHLGGQLTLMLLAGIGRGIEVHEVDLELYRRAIEFLATLQPTHGNVHESSLRSVPMGPLGPGRLLAGLLADLAGAGGNPVLGGSAR
jgi:3-dehydroquinate synthase